MTTENHEFKDTPRWWLLVALAGFVLLVGIWATWQGTHIDPATKLYYEGQAAMDAGAYDEAVAKFTEAIELDPDNERAFLGRGYAHDWLGNYEQAVEDYTVAIELGYDPLSEAYTARGAAYAWGLKDYERAIKEYTKAIELDPDYEWAYGYRGSAYARLRNYEQAKAELEKAIELTPDFAWAYMDLCWWGSIYGDVENVMAACKRAIELEPNNPLNRESRGLARALSGDYDGAIEDFEFAVEQWEADYGKQWLTWLSAEERQEIVATRKGWIAELKAGRDPFDEATLQQLIEGP